MKNNRSLRSVITMSETTTSSPEVKTYLSGKRKIVDEHLDQLLPSDQTYPPVLNQAMRYSVFAGGKRLRPVLAIATGEALDGDPERIMILACALEMIHTYSLIHDDLPAMDDDDLRRGRASCHREFGEGIAILAGNGLMNLAFQVLADMPVDTWKAFPNLRALSYLNRAIGTENGVIAGQVVDLTTQGKPFSENELDYIHSWKTGALIRASIVCAAIISGADDLALEKLSRFGIKVGVAFQIVDDMLDIVGDSMELGKTTGKDEKEQKATYPALFGLEESRRKTEELVREAEDELGFLGDRGRTLKELAHFISVRRY